MSKKVSQKDVLHIASLAHLTFDPERVAQFTQKMEEVLGYVAMLDKVDVKDVEPTSHAAPSEGWLREDTPAIFDGARKLVGGAPASEEGLFTVPKVI